MATVSPNCPAGANNAPISTRRISALGFFCFFGLAGVSVDAVLLFPLEPSRTGSAPFPLQAPMAAGPRARFEVPPSRHLHPTGGGHGRLYTPHSEAASQEDLVVVALAQRLVR